jgi:uncharacterized C2H2 Zn-finger protein
MPKRSPECESCQLFSGYLGAKYLVCGIHPCGPAESPCPDHAPVVEDWVPVGGAYYDGELVRDSPFYMTTEDRLHLVETHPRFTGRCPQCGTIFQETPQYIGTAPPATGWMTRSPKRSHPPAETKAKLGRSARREGTCRGS